MLVQPITAAMKKAKCTLTSDGWQDAQKRPLLNVCAITPAGAQFIRAIDITGETKVLSSPCICSWHVSVHHVMHQ